MQIVRLLFVGATLLLGTAQSTGTIVLASDLADGFYGAEPPFDASAVSWLGLVSGAGGSALRPSRLAWTRLDVLPGAEGPSFALESDLDTALAYFAEVAALSEGPVAEATPRVLDLSEGSPAVRILLDAAGYELRVESGYPETCSAELLLTGRGMTQRIPISAVLGCGDPHFRVHWAGDLDGDGALDFLATFSMKYSYHPRQLYLSSAAQTGELVGLAASFDRTAS